MPFFSALLAQQGPLDSPLVPNSVQELRGPFEAVLAIFKEIFPALLNIQEAIGEFLGLLLRIFGNLLLGILNALDPGNIADNITNIIRLVMSIFKTLLDVLPLG